MQGLIWVWNKIPQGTLAVFLEEIFWSQTQESCSPVLATPCTAYVHVCERSWEVEGPHPNNREGSDP